MPAKTTHVIVEYAARAERIEIAMHKLAAGVPGTKGLGPKDRAELLHAELERRVAIARDALTFQPGDRRYE